MADHDKHSEEHGDGGGHGGGHGGGGHAAHGGGGHEEHEGAPEWLISFADNVALMMGFFVILLAMNMAKQTTGGIGGDKKMGGAPSNEMLDFVISMRDSFNNPINPYGTDPREEQFRQRMRERSLDVNRSRQPEEPGKGKESQAIRPTDLSSLGGTLAFDDDSDTLSPGNRQRAEQIAAKLRGQRFMIEIRGHASPSETMRQVEKGIALGHSRALAVARVLVSEGIRWDQLRIVSCGVSERKVERTYDDADRLNQRVDVVPTGDPAPDAPGGSEVADHPQGGGHE